MKTSKSKISAILFFVLNLIFIQNRVVISQTPHSGQIEEKVTNLLKKMTLEEKVGQMCQRNAAFGHEEAVRKGKIGSLLNETNLEALNKIQHIAVEESRLGIPLLFGRDVVHGFRTIFPIPLGLAATWNPKLIEKGARIAAIEAAASGIRWTFAPMLDISRDPRWGRIAESFGEDTYLTGEMAKAMVRGFQGDELSKQDAIVACPKHFAGYGAAEGGRDYNTTYIPEPLMRNVYLPPFKAAIDAGALTLMAGFHEINGIPATGNYFLLKQILKKEWQFKGFVVSDWASIVEMINHGICENEKAAALRALQAGVDMEMASTAYEKYVKQLISEGSLTEQALDDAVRRILRVKFKLGLFDQPYTYPDKFPDPTNQQFLKEAYRTSLQSLVLLKNENHVLPLGRNVKRIAVIGPLADDQFEQLGTWTFDKNIQDTRTPLQSIRKFVSSNIAVTFVKALQTSRSDTSDFQEAVFAAKNSDVVLLFLGEEAIITGEAHCRANINLPGAQEKLIHAISRTDKPIILTVMAGRPLTMGNILPEVDALLYAWHPGSMGGPAITDILFGKESPSGKLPVTFPKMVGQVPIYYNHKNTGRPPRAESWVPIDKIPVRAMQTSLGNESHYLDAGFKPQFPFGFGLSYTTFKYSNMSLSSKKIKLGESLQISATVKNTGNFRSDEIVQLYIRDLVGSITRPVKELKGFKRISLEAGESKNVIFTLHTDDLAFYNHTGQRSTEPGKFHVWIANSSDSGLQAEFEIIK